MTTVTPFLWYDNQLEEAIELYASVFPGVQVHSTNRHPDGSLFFAEFEVAGTRVRGMNAGPHFPFTEAISLFVDCEDQEEVDRYWAALTADGGEESMCGWLKDKYGLSWQIIPKRLMELVSSGPPEQVERVRQAMYKMRKIDVAALEAAAASAD